MYAAVKSLLLRALKVPHEPVPPAGSAESLRVFRASPRYLRYRLVGWAILQVWALFTAALAFAVILGALSSAPPPGWAKWLVHGAEGLVLAAVVAGSLLSLLTLRLDYEMRHYMVTDRSLRIREGVWHVHEMTMTFANIQNITIEQGPIQRLFGIADVRVQSAGGGGLAQAQPGDARSGMRDLHVGWFRGVDDAAGIRDLVLARLKTLRDAGLGDHDDDAARVYPASAANTTLPLLAQLRDEMRGLRLAAERQARS